MLKAQNIKQDEFSRLHQDKKIHYLPLSSSKDQSRNLKSIHYSSENLETKPSE